MGKDDHPGHFSERRFLPRQESGEAYAQLHQAHQALVRAQLRRSCRGLADEDLEDLEQEVWLAVWTALPGFQGHSAFSTWLVGITKNVFYRWLRHKRSGELALLRLTTWDGDRNDENNEGHPCDRLDVSEAINRLSELEHHALRLRYFHHYTDQEIASCLNLPLGTVKGQIRRGLRRLQQSLVPMAPSDPRPVDGPMKHGVEGGNRSETR